MYHPPRGGVRGGADQFNWEDVKSDKHRENYLGHSVKAPVGRWQKGKDLLWYSKDRSSSTDGGKRQDSSEISAIKRAEEEAMMAALGHKVVRKETQPLTKEEMAEVLKRNTSERDTLSVERIEGVGVMSARAAMLVNSGSHKGGKAEGILFETPSVGRDTDTFSDNEKHAKPSGRKLSSRKSSKKHKKEKKKHKKKKKHKQNSSASDYIADDNDDKSSSERRRDNVKHHYDEANRSRHLKHSLKLDERHQCKIHKLLSDEKSKISKHRRRKDRQDSSSENEINSKFLHSPPIRDIHYAKRRRHDSSSCSD